MRPLFWNRLFPSFFNYYYYYSKEILLLLQDCSLVNRIPGCDSIYIQEKLLCNPNSHSEMSRVKHFCVILSCQKWKEESWNQVSIWNIWFRWCLHGGEKRLALLSHHKNWKPTSQVVWTRHHILEYLVFETALEQQWQIILSLWGHKEYNYSTNHVFNINNALCMFLSHYLVIELLCIFLSVIICIKCPLHLLLNVGTLFISPCSFHCRGYLKEIHPHSPEVIHFGHSSLSLSFCVRGR